VSKPDEDDITIELDGRQVVISSPGKVLFSERGETKPDLIEFYRAVRDPLLAAMGGRPVLLQSFPDGAEANSFFQKRVARGSTPWLESTVVSTPNGTTSNALVIADLARRVGGEQGLPRLPRVADPGRRPRARRRAAHRPRPHARRHVPDGA